MRVIKAFSRWLHEEEYTTTEALARIKRPKMDKTVVDVLTDEEIAKVFSDFKPNCFKGSRNLAIYMLLIDTGIRASELYELTLDHIDLKKGEILVMGQGRRGELGHYA